MTRPSLIFGVLMLFAACNSKPREDEAKQGSSAAWRPVDIEGLVTVDFPTDPKVTRDELPNPNGSGTMMSVTYTSPATNDLPFVGVSVKTFPPDQKLDEKGAFDGGRDNAVQKLHATLVSERNLTLGAYRGRELVMSTVGPNGSLITHNRIYVMGQSIVTVTTAAPEGTHQESVGLVFSSLAPISEP